VPTTKPLSTAWDDPLLAFLHICGIQNEYIPKSTTGRILGTVPMRMEMKARRKRATTKKR
jgi:hypothetical protein